MNDKIYPIAYTLAPGLVRPLYYLGFPAAWKAELVEIARANSPRFKDEYGLPTNALKKMVDSWMEGVIALNPLKKDSHDEHWLTSCRAYTERDITMLYHLLKIWVAAAYIVPDKAPLSVKTRARAFCERIRPEELLALRSEAQVCLTAEDGTVAGEAYAALPLLAINRLLGREVTLNGRALHLCYSGKNQLISRPVTDEKSGHAYSFVFNFSVQTTPPDRSALLLCQMSTRRWIPGYYGKDRSPFLAEAVNAHIAASGDKYCQVPIAYDRRRRQLDWQSQDKECYNICGYEPLPDAVDVLTHPERYAGTVLLPYKNGMGGFVPSKIGTGISVKDKAELYARFGEHLSDLIGVPPEALRVRRKGQTLDTYRSPEEYENREAFRSWVCRCAETDEITFELYGLWKDPVQRETLERLREKLLRDFGEDIVGSCLRVHICEREAGDLADGLADSDPQTQI